MDTITQATAPVIALHCELLHILRDRDITQESLGGAFGVHANSVSRWGSGSMMPPALAVARLQWLVDETNAWYHRFMPVVFIPWQPGLYESTTAADRLMEPGPRFSACTITEKTASKMEVEFTVEESGGPYWYFVKLNRSGFRARDDEKKTRFFKTPALRKGGKLSIVLTCA